MAECNFESLLLDVVEAVQSGKRTDVLDAPAMRSMQSRADCAKHTAALSKPETLL